jgi:hypothetical protein
MFNSIKSAITGAWIALTLLIAAGFAWNSNTRLEALENSNQELLWTFRQVTFHQVVSTLVMTDAHPENTVAVDTARYAYSLVHKADDYLNKSDTHQALPLLRQAQYEAEKAREQLKCGEWLCTK